MTKYVGKKSPQTLKISTMYEGYKWNMTVRDVAVWTVRIVLPGAAPLQVKPERLFINK